MAEGESLRRTLSHRSVWAAFTLVLGLWIFQMESHPIGKPLTPLFDVLVAGFWTLRPSTPA